MADHQSVICFAPQLVKYSQEFDICVIFLQTVKEDLLCFDYLTNFSSNGVKRNVFNGIEMFIKNF